MRSARTTGLDCHISKPI